MQIVLHVGPHKTGTTSVQAFLGSCIGSTKPKAPVWYPLPETNGPGHAALARDTLGLRGAEPGDDLCRLVREAHRSGTEKLVLSSEGFSFMYKFEEVGRDRMRAAIGEHPLHMVITLSPVLRRAASTWQEMVKHGFRHTLLEQPEVLFRQPGLRPDLMSVLDRMLEPHRITLVLVGGSDPPEQLLRNIVSTMDLQVELQNSEVRVKAIRNESLGFVEVELLRHLNVMLHRMEPDKPKEQHAHIRRALIDALYNKEWRRVRPDIPIALSEEIKGQLRQLATDTVQDIRALADRRPIEIRGDLSVLLQ